MLEEAIRYPWNGEKNVETILIGGVLTLLGFLLIPMLPVYGYVVRVLRDVSTGDDEFPPVFEDWESLFVDGLKAFVVLFVYSVVAALVVGLVVLGLVLPVTFTQGPGTGGPNVLGLVLALFVAAVAVVVSVAVAYLLPAAVAAFARTGRLGAAFSPGEIRSIGGHRGYAEGWVVALVVTILVSVLGGVVSATGVGALLAPFISFYGTVAAAYAIGEGISDLVVVEREDGSATMQRSTARGGA